MVHSYIAFISHSSLIDQFEDVLGEDSVSQIIFGLVLLAAGTPCAYVCWMRAVYNAFKKDSSFSFFLFFFSFFLKICIVILFAIGPPGN